MRNDGEQKNYTAVEIDLIAFLMQELQSASRSTACYDDINPEDPIDAKNDFQHPENK